MRCSRWLSQGSSAVEVIDSVLIANRGEIAVRIARTLRRLGVTAYGVYAPVDAGAPHTRAVDRAISLKPVPDAGASAPYLDPEAIIEAAQACGARAIHPGYGFLAESAEAARACEQAGLIWIGPGAEAIAGLGDKAEAKRLAAEAGVSVVPGLNHDPDSEAVAAFAEEHGYPLMIKAVAGGGGKGMRRIENAGEIAAALEAARREAVAAFGAGDLIVERLIEPARHIEVQFAVDADGNAVSLGERECSLQRRHQKLIEESPSPAVTPALRERLGRAATALARAAGYRNLGTAEFLVDFDDPDRFYFLEINARLQVEHPVTEAVTGLDLVELQLALAAGELLGEEVTTAIDSLNGHAIEARICAERPVDNFMPATGKIALYHEPSGVRVDSGVEQGSVVTADFDPMLVKLIAHAPTRERAIERLRRALNEIVMLGVETNADFLAWLLDRPETRDGATAITTVERLAGEEAYVAVRNEALPEALKAAATACARAAIERSSPGEGFEKVDGWRLFGTGRGFWEVRDEQGNEHHLVAGPDSAAELDVWLLSRESVAVQGNFGTFNFDFVRDLRLDAAPPGSLEASLPGVVLAVEVSPGDRVDAGQTLLTIESMKMEIAVTAPEAGEVAAVTVSPGDHVARGQLLAEMREEG